LKPSPHEQSSIVSISSLESSGSRGFRAFLVSSKYFSIQVSLVNHAHFQMVFHASSSSRQMRYSKAVMIVLGVLGLFLHGARGRYNPLPRDWGFSLKWSARVGLLFLACSVVAVAVSASLGFFRPVDAGALLVDFVWFLVFVGFAEETFFRGYVQERLNEVFSGVFGSFLGVRFEWHRGTLIAGVFFFGLAHLLGAVNPFTGRFALDYVLLGVTASACFIGVVLGVIKEKTGGVLLPAVIHGLLDFTTFGVGKVTGLLLSGIASVVALFLFFAFLFEKILLG